MVGAGNPGSGCGRLHRVYRISGANVLHAWDVRSGRLESEPNLTLNLGFRYDIQMPADSAA